MEENRNAAQWDESLASVDGSRPRRTVRRWRGGPGWMGFSLIELVIVVVIIGIIAAIAIPRMSRGAAGAGEAALAQNLAVLRNALDLFQADHGKLPDPNTGVSIDQMLTRYSNIEGDATSSSRGGDFQYGPYLRTIPPMTIGAKKGKNGIGVVGAPSDEANVAWRYDPINGIITAVTTGSDTGGKLYTSY